ncbi:hypothetical protein QBC38DRAFT_460158 [Podospora fimiseda]|uniref:Heterokaryon incompatibility domain-containing protein n=1 Tax=Podospora fimiseda TaxID=252190 RepID=A0AAN6YRL8_9PEZI|nr:hypothetical protein QBC38DRAFT_460158 [Podospora fimiseda]
MTASRVLNYLWPPWLHFHAIRGEVVGEAGASPSALDIKQLAVSGPSRTMFGYMLEPPFTLHVRADEGTEAHTSGDCTGAIVTKSLSLSDMPVIKAWYEECHDNHKSCRYTLSQTGEVDPMNSALPARLIKINFKAQNNLELTLCETEGEFGIYIALSHHGSAVVQRTNIWIASICIVQDDAGDWRKKSARMAEYYQRAWITIASMMTDENGGLLSMRLEPDQIPTIIRLPYRNANSEERGFFYLQPSRGSRLRKAFMEEVGNCELQQRGWIFQEFMLSRRLLTFSKTGVT